MNVRARSELSVTAVCLRAAKQRVSLGEMNIFYVQANHELQNMPVNEVPKTFMEESCRCKSSHYGLPNFKCSVTNHVMFHVKFGPAFFVTRPRFGATDSDLLHVTIRETSYMVLKAYFQLSIAVIAASSI